MNDKEIIKKLLETSSNGIITTQQVTSTGLRRSVLQKLVEDIVVLNVVKNILLVQMF